MRQNSSYRSLLTSHAAQVQSFENSITKQAKSLSRTAASLALLLLLALPPAIVVFPAGANYIKASNTMDAAAAASAAPPSAAASVAPSPRQPGPGPHADATHAAAAAAALPPLESLEQQLAAEIGPPHNYTGLPEAFVRAAAAAAAAREAAGSGSEPTEATVAADGSAVDGRTVAAPVAVMAGAAAAQHHGGKAGVQQQLQKSGTRAARDAAALAAAEAALKGPGGLVEALRPDMEQLRVAAEVRGMDYLSLIWCACFVLSLACA